MDLRLNVTRRSINLSVYLVFDLEARRFKFLGENLLGASNFWVKVCGLRSIFQVEWLIATLIELVMSIFSVIDSLNCEHTDAMNIVFQNCFKLVF